MIKPIMKSLPNSSNSDSSMKKTHLKTCKVFYHNIHIFHYKMDSQYQFQSSTKSLMDLSLKKLFEVLYTFESASILNQIKTSLRYSTENSTISK